MSVSRTLFDAALMPEQPILTDVDAAVAEAFLCDADRLLISHLHAQDIGICNVAVRTFLLFVVQALIEE